MRAFKADLHIHTCLSPCAELEMSPRGIVREAKRKGVQIIGICDHNSAENVQAVRRTAAREGIRVVGGMEITSREEVHVLALFDDEEDLRAQQELVYAHLDGTNDEKLYGEQVVVNEEDEVTGFNSKLLIGATTLTLDALVAAVHARHGLAIASHVDREGFGIIGQLGFIPAGLQLDALELRDPSRRESIPGHDRFPFITSSDAHRLDAVGTRCTSFLMCDASVAEIRKSLSGIDGREVRI